MNKKRGLHKFLCAMLAALPVGGCGALEEIANSDPTSLGTYIDVFVDDVSPPPESDDPYAQKLYQHSSNVLIGSDPENLLFTGDFNYAEFVCRRDDPARVLVGFSKKDFSRVTIGGYWNSSLDVAGYIANPIHLAKAIGTRRFVIDLEKGESGFADSNPIDEWGFGGAIQIDTGTGGIYFDFSAMPREGYGVDEAVIGIDYLKVGG
jgi:hypothetical protein